MAGVQKGLAVRHGARISDVHERFLGCACATMISQPHATNTSDFINMT